MNKKKFGKEYIDDLTSLYNRRYLHKEINKRIEDSEKRDLTFSIVLIDLDYFKNVNDTYGHTRGDSVIKEFAVFLKDLLRKDDIVIRYGGDEFICVLPKTNYRHAEMISERIIEQCRAEEFAQIRLTLSIGISSFPENGKDWETLFELADRNLYCAKRHGRDRVGFFEKESKELIIPSKEIVGRNTEISNIKKFIRVILNEKEGAACISGEIGIGKTRLVREIVDASDFKEIQFLNSNLSATTKSIPYFPFREIIRSLFYRKRKNIEEIPEVYQIELNKIVPELFDKSKEVDENILMVDKYRLFEGVRKFLELKFSDGPMIISLDNVHWADNGSLELFHYLLKSMKEKPIFFFLIYRAEEFKESPFQKILQSITRKGLCHTINLKPLKISDVSRMLSLILDGRPPAELIPYIFNESGGNPFFIEELIKSLDANDGLIWDKNEWIFDKKKKVVIPYSLEGVVERKLSMVGEEAKDVLEYMAVIGKEFGFKSLLEITGKNEGHLFDLIDEILEARLVKEKSGERYWFSEDIIREIVYGKISDAKLKRYHQAVGEKTLELHREHIEENVEELAKHFYKSGDRHRAIEYSIMAGDRAKAIYANRDAIRFYTWAIDCFKESDIEDEELRRIKCLKKRADVLKLIGEGEKAIPDLEQVIKISKELKNEKEEADCLIVLSRVYIDMGKYEKATRNTEIAHDIYRKLKDRNGKAESLNNYANIYFYLGEYQKALEFNHRSLKIRKEMGNHKREAALLNNIGIIYQNLGQYSKALKSFNHSLKIIDKIGNRKLKANNLNNTGIINYYLGNYSDALRLYEHSLSIFQEMGDRTGEARARNNIGSIYHIQGKYNKAFEHYENSLKIVEEIGDLPVEGTILHNMGIISYNLCNYNKALNLYKHSLRIVKDIGDRKMELANLACIGDIYIEKNDFATAEGHLTKAHSIARELKSKLLLTYFLLHLVNFHLEKDNLTEVKRLLKKIFTLTRELGSKEFKAGALSISGLLYTKEKKWKKATSAFNESIALLKELESEFDLAKVYYYQGLMFKEAGDESNAKKYLKKAKRIFNKLNVNKWALKIEQFYKGL